MHCTLRYGTLLMMVPQVGARDRMESILDSVVIPFTMEINFSSKVYSKRLLKRLHEAKPIDLYFNAGQTPNCTIMQLQTKDRMTSITGISL